MTSAWQWWSAEEIAAASGCPSEAIAKHWPRIAAALNRRGLWEREIRAAVLGTIAIETASTFRPIQEYKDWAAYPETGYPPHYDGGPEYHGRGYLQLTHLSGYRAAGEMLGVDLAASPDLALDPAYAAEIVAWWFATRGIPSADGTKTYPLADLCRQRDWRWVRVAVQGGTAGLDRLVRIASRLLGEPATVVYDPDARVDRQPDAWSCSVQSTEWLLRSLGRNPSDAWIERQLVGAVDAAPPPIVTREHGLMDHTGRQLAGWLQIEYGDEMGLVFESRNPVSWDDVAALAGRQPVLLGGRAWGHWSGVRRLSEGRLGLANPAPGWKGVGEELSRAEWDTLGSWSIVTVPIPTAGPVPKPPPPPPPPGVPLVPDSPLILEIRARLDELEKEIAHHRETLAYLCGDGPESVATAMQAALDTLKRHKPS